MSECNQRLCTHSIAVFLVLFGLGFGILQRFVPPTPPATSAADIAALYRDHAFAQRLGAVIQMLAGSFLVPFAAAVSMQVERIEGARVLSYTQLASGLLCVLLFYIPGIAWVTVAFRPERDPQLLLLMNDFAWFAFMLPFMCLMLQLIAVGLAIVSDQAPVPVYPRWVGYFSFWGAVILVTGGAVPFFHSGPFDWHGLFTFWLGGIPFFGWFVIMYIYTLKAIKRQYAR